MSYLKLAPLVAVLVTSSCARQPRLVSVLADAHQLPEDSNDSGGPSEVKDPSSSDTIDTLPGEPFVCNASETFEKNPCEILVKLLRHSPHDPEVYCLDRRWPNRRVARATECSVADAENRINGWISEPPKEPSEINCQLPGFFGEGKTAPGLAKKGLDEWERKLESCFRAEGFRCCGSECIPAISKAGYSVRSCSIYVRSNDALLRPDRNLGIHLECVYDFDDGTTRKMKDSSDHMIPCGKE